jgi:hypothetical protein
MKENIGTIIGCVFSLILIGATLISLEYPK